VSGADGESRVHPAEGHRPAEPDPAVVGEAGSGMAGVELAAGLAPDIVLMDLRMPDGDGVKATARGETVLAPSVASTLVRQVRKPAPPALSAREAEVLRLVAQGRTNAEIGKRLYIAEATVKTHLLRIFSKLEWTTGPRRSPPR
jgi:DNA-binding NarL/FixJ family response regulator